MATKKENVESVDMSQFRRIHKEEKKESRTITLPFTKRTMIMGIVLIALVVAAIIGFNHSSSSKYDISVTDGDKTLVSGDVTITKQGYFEYLLDNNSGNAALDLAYNKICDEVITDKKAINKEVKALEKSYTSYLSTADPLQTYAESLGYKDTDTLEKEVIIPEAKQNLMVDKYLDEEYDNVVKNYKVSYIKAVTFEKESAALKALKKIKKQSDFDDLMKENTSTSADYGLVTTKTEESTVDANILKKLNNFYKMDKNGVYSKVIKTSSDTYAVVYVYNADKEKHKETITEALSSMSDIVTETKAHYLKENNFTIYDEKLKEEIEALDESYVN